MERRRFSILEKMCFFDREDTLRLWTLVLHPFALATEIKKMALGVPNASLIKVNCLGESVIPQRLNTIDNNNDNSNNKKKFFKAAHFLSIYQDLELVQKALFITSLTSLQPPVNSGLSVIPILQLRKLTLRGSVTCLRAS